MTSVGIPLITFVVVVSHCQAESTKPLNLKYHVSTDFQNWFQALINCKSAGMELASIVTETEEGNLETFLQQYKYTQGYWISGTNLGNGEYYYWASTGTKFQYTKWLINQPDNYNKGENCVQYGLYNESRNLYVGWNDLSCQSKLQYICEEAEICNEIIKI